MFHTLGMFHTRRNVDTPFFFLLEDTGDTCSDTGPLVLGPGVADPCAGVGGC